VAEQKYSCVRRWVIIIKGGKDKRYLSGVIWDIYLYILTSNEPVGVREIWRGLKLSQPSLVQYHINNLLEMGLITQNREGKYIVEEKARIDILRSFLLLRGRLISRMTIYGAFLLGLLMVYLFAWPINWSFRDLLVLFVCLFSSSIFFFEAYNQHKSLRKDVQRV